MSIDVRNYIKERLKEYDPSLDTRDGSVINDILIAPLSLVLNKYEINQRCCTKSLGT